MRKAASIFALLLTVTACLTSSLGQAASTVAPAPKGAWCGTAPSQADTAWPGTFTAVAGTAPLLPRAVVERTKLRAGHARSPAADGEPVHGRPDGGGHAGRSAGGADPVASLT